MECKNSALCVFDRPATQTDVMKSSVTAYYPITSITSGGPIEFHVPGSTEDYIDVNDIYLYVRYKIVNAADGSAIGAGKKVGVNNLAIATLFQDVALTLGEVQIEGGQQNYPYLAYFPTLMQMHPAAQRSHMQIHGWLKDEAGKFDDEANTGFTARRAWVNNSKPHEVYGSLYLDFTRQSRYLISQTDMRLRLVPQKPEFALNSYETGGAYRIVFQEVILDVRRLLLNPSVINGHAVGLRDKNAVYPINHSKLINFTIPKGQKSYIKDRLFPQQSPKLLLVAMVENEAFNGAYTKSPFNFQHFNLSELALYRQGESIPGRPFSPDFDSGLYTRSYVNTMQTFNYFNADDTNGLTYREFGNGYTVYAFDLTPDNNVSAPYRHAIQSNNLRLALTFDKNLPTTINVLYAVFDSTVEVTLTRDILTEYNR